jgi:imidazolonepropionase
VTALVIDNIGRLVTCDPTWGDGSLSMRPDAALVVEDGYVRDIAAAGTVTADDRVDVEGRCVLPGFVDSHTHLVFAGDRSKEFAARMAGQPYAAGGIRVTTAATRAASNTELLQLARGRLAEARRNGTTTVEIKSGYGLSTVEEARCLHIAGELTPDVTFLGAHVVPEEFEGRADAYVAEIVERMLPACAPLARFADAFCEEGAFDEDQCRAVLAAAQAHGLVPKLHANQLHAGPGVRLAVELDAASADHCTHLTDGDIEALAGAAGATVATLLPASDFSTRQPYPPGRRLQDAGATIALATNCNPGSSYTTSVPFVIALAVREAHLTVEEAVLAATAGGAAALRRTDVGRLSPGCRADITVLQAPGPEHLAYRPGVPLVAAVLQAGEVTYRDAALWPT